MSLLTLSWLEDESPRDLVRWAVAGAIVVGIHAGAIAYLLAGISRTKSAAIPTS